MTRDLKARVISVDRVPDTVMQTTVRLRPESPDGLLHEADGMDIVLPGYFFAGRAHVGEVMTLNIQTYSRIMT